MNKKLEPCYCGGNAKIIKEHRSIGGIGMYGFAVDCTECCLTTTAYATEAEAIAAWNTRPEARQLSVEQLKEHEGAVWLICHHWSGYALPVYDAMSNSFFFVRREGGTINRPKEQYNSTDKWGFKCFTGKPREEVK